MDRIPVKIMLPKDFLKILEMRADQEELSTDQLIQMVLSDYLLNIKPHNN
jgi:hypothetical protein